MRRREVRPAAWCKAGQPLLPRQVLAEDFSLLVHRRPGMLPRLVRRQAPVTRH